MQERGFMMIKHPNRDPKIGAVYYVSWGNFRTKFASPWKLLAQLNCGFGLEYTVRIPS